MISIVYDSPVGSLTLISNGAALEHLEFENPRHAYTPAPAGKDKILDETRRQLDKYFAGKLRVFDLPLAPQGTEFQKRVWTALLTIPYGATRTYGQQATTIGQPNASRAVGLANGRNPISIIVPCHRVIRGDGSLGGYRWGLALKQQLLGREVVCAR